MGTFSKYFPLLAIICLGFSIQAYAQTAMPLSPLNLKFTLTDYNKLDLTWYDNSENEEEFRIYRSPAYSGTWSLIGKVDKNVTSFSQIINSGSYDYRIVSCNISGCSADTGSNIILVSLIKDTIAPSIPGDFSIPQKEVTHSQTKLYWSASQDNIKLSHYNVYRSAGSANFFSLIASTSSTGFTDDKGLAPVTNYYYKIKAVDAEGNQSQETFILNIITPPLSGEDSYIRIASPNGGECFTLPTNLSIKWTGVGVNLAAIYFNGKKISLTSGTSVEWYMDSSVAPTRSGSIKITAVDEKGMEGISDTNDKPFIISEDCSKEDPLTQISVPAVPAFVRANLVTETRNILITWVDNSSNETEFRIYRRQLPEGKWELLGKAGTNMTYYTDYEVPPEDYEYDISACNSDGCSAYSNIYRITAIATLPTPVAGKVYGSSEISDGDMVSASGSSDPDIYIVNEHGYKRLFLNPVIFGFYGHLGGFERVKTISGITRDTYKTSSLFRNCETNDEKVYGVEVTGEDAGTLHWIDTSGEQAIIDDPDFFKKVFCINNNEFNWYQRGLNYSSVKEIPTYSR